MALLLMRWGHKMNKSGLAFGMSACHKVGAGAAEQSLTWVILLETGCGAARFF